MTDAKKEMLLARERLNASRLHAVISDEQLEKGLLEPDAKAVQEAYRKILAKYEAYIVGDIVRWKTKDGKETNIATDNLQI